MTRVHSRLNHPGYDDDSQYPENDPLDNGDSDGGALEDANETAMDTWARHYDDLNGAPESDEDR